MHQFLTEAGLSGTSSQHFVRGAAAGIVALVSFVGGATSDALGGSPVTTWVVVSAIAGGAATMFYKLLQRNDERVDDRIEVDMTHIKALQDDLDTWRSRAVKAEIAKARLEERLRMIEGDA